MVVEADDDIAQAIARKLGANGYEVEIASEPQSVMERIDSGLADWDVVILDAGMPGMSGLDVVKHLRDVGSTGSVIMLTRDRTSDDGELTPLTEAKRRASSAFEKRYLVRVMEKSKGSVSEAARLAGLDRTNFRRLLQRHGLDPVTFKT